MKSEILIRRADTPELQDLYIQSAAEVYARGEMPSTPEEGPNYDNGDHYYVMTVDGEAAASYKVIPYRAHCHGVLIPMGGVASVAVRPQFRAKGLGTQLMRFCNAEMRRCGMPLASLYPYRGSFYRRLGYELCGSRMQIKCPENRFPDVKSDLPVRKICQEELSDLYACGEAFTRRTNGGNVRTPEHWVRRMGKNFPLVFAVGDPIQGYVTTSMEGTFWEDLQFGEVVWTSKAGYEAVLQVMRGLVINRSAAVWWEPGISAFAASYMDQGVSLSLDRAPMYRLLDVRAAFESLQPNAEGRFSFAVEDPDIAENTGTWTVEFGEGHCSLGRGSNPDFVLTIQQLTQAFLGEPSLRDLVRFQQVHLGNEEVLEQAIRLLPETPVFLNEFF